MDHHVFVIRHFKVGKCDFRRRLECIEKEIVGSRNKSEQHFLAFGWNFVWLKWLKVHHGGGDQQGEGAVQHKKEGLLGRGRRLQVAKTRVYGTSETIQKYFSIPKIEIFYEKYLCSQNLLTSRMVWYSNRLQRTRLTRGEEMTRWLNLPFEKLHNLVLKSLKLIHTCSCSDLEVETCQYEQCWLQAAGCVTDNHKAGSHNEYG